MKRFVFLMVLVLGMFAPLVGAQDSNIDMTADPIADWTPGQDCGQEVCAERQPNCTTTAWKGVSYCAIRPLQREDGLAGGYTNDEIYPRVEVRFSKAAIENNAKVLIRLCEDVPGFDPCQNYYMKAQKTSLNAAGKLYRFTPPLGTNDCSYFNGQTWETVHHYYTQAIAKVGNQYGPKLESGNTPSGNEGSALLCVLLF